VRVLYLHSSSGQYGADRQLGLLAGGLDPERFCPLVVLPGPGPLADALRAEGVEVLERGLAVVRRSVGSPRGVASLGGALGRDAVALTALIRRRRIGLVHSNTSVVLGGAVAAAAARVPHVWHVREIYARYGALWPVHRRLLLAGSAALPCVSAATAAQFGPDPRVSIIGDGLAVDARRTARAPARRALGLPERVPAIAVLGRITDWKGQELLVRALAEPALLERGAIAVIAGDAWPGAEDRAERVRDLARSLGVIDRVFMVGFRVDVENVYGAADLVAVPSTSPDPLPGAAIEAAAAGCAVLAANHGGLPEIIRDGETGRLFDPGDAGALARIAASLVDDPLLRGQLGTAAAADVRERFSPALLLERTQALYDTVLSSNGAPAPD
jgi:glycosyltransferase involved in cell wall biosynthesis